MRLGDASHRVLDRLARGGHFRELEPAAWVEAAWAEEVGREGASSIEDGSAERWGSPEGWPELQLKRARLKRVALRLCELLRSLPPGAVLLTEETLTACEGRLRGKPDLIIRAPGAHRVIDYKSGAVVERKTGQLRESYERQLRLYAFMEAQASGAWPDSAHLIPLEGPPVEIGVEERECRDASAEALAAMDAYNGAVPGPQPPTPGTDTCTRCPFVATCWAFWATCDPTWLPALLAVRGRVLAVSSSPLGGVSVTLAPEEGSLLQDSIAIRNVDPDVHPQARTIAPGDIAAAVGLREEPERGTYALAKSARLAILRSAES